MEEKLKSWLHNDLLYLCVLLTLVALLAFALGRFSVLRLPSGSGGVAAVAMSYTTIASTTPSLPARPETGTVVEEARKPSTTNTASGTEVVASKNGTKYHLPSCPGAKQIKPENLLTFPSEQAAQAAGLGRAQNCKTFPDLLP